MNFNLFIEHIVKALQEIFEGKKVSTNKVEKNNGLVLDGIVIFDPCKNLSPTIYINPYYEQYLAGRDLEDIIDSIANIYRNNLPELDFDMTNFTDWEKVKSTIIYCLVNYNKNIDLLSNIPHIKFLDFAIIFKCLVSVENEFASILIRNEHLNYWNVTAEELHNIAKINTPELLPPSLRSVLSVLKDMYGNEMYGVESDLPMYILSNIKNMNGSGCILYENILKDFSDKIHKNLFILPSSIHEVILLPDDSDIIPKELKEMVGSVNDTMVSVDEILSENVYFYDRDKEEIILV